MDPRCCVQAPGGFLRRCSLLVLELVLLVPVLVVLVWWCLW